MYAKAVHLAPHDFAYRSLFYPHAHARANWRVRTSHHGSQTSTVQALAFFVPTWLQYCVHTWRNASRSRQNSYGVMPIRVAMCHVRRCPGQSRYHLMPHFTWGDCCQGPVSARRRMECGGGLARVPKTQKGAAGLRWEFPISPRR